MEKLYRFYWDCGRMGDLESLFIEDHETVDALVGHRIYFGEVLGKHSEIYGTLEAGDVTVVSEDQDFISKLKGLLGTSVSGLNPIDYASYDLYYDETTKAWRSYE